MVPLLDNQENHNPNPNSSSNINHPTKDVGYYAIGGPDVSKRLVSVCFHQALDAMTPMQSTTSDIPLNRSLVINTDIHDPDHMVLLGPAITLALWQALV